MNSLVNAIEDQHETATTCRHHWIIETPSGPVSKGVCKLCGEERDFVNLYYGYEQANEPSKVSDLRDLVDIESDE